MDFPAVIASEVETPHGLAKALGVTPVQVSKNRMDWLVELASEEEVRNLKPDFQALGEIPARGFIVTARASTPGYDFVSRFFAPGAGINEDPVTGSAHCSLGPYWQEKLGKSEFVAYQASARGGVVYVRVEGDRVKLGGKAVTVMRGEILQ
jgi:PhzF family phenazine biosynthesis protein